MNTYIVTIGNTNVEVKADGFEADSENHLNFIDEEGDTIALFKEWNYVVRKPE